MRVLDPGHVYRLDSIDGDQRIDLVFVKRSGPRGRTDHYPGTLCQEVIRALIDRVQYVDEEVSWWGNDLILTRLKECLGLFELRAVLRKDEKGEVSLVDLPTGPDGHWLLTDAPTEG